MGEMIQENIVHGNKILRTLLTNGPLDRPNLIINSGLSDVQCVKALFTLHRNKYIRQDERDSKYHITSMGKEACPPAYVKDTAKYSPDQKKGYRHVHGIAGKFDYSQPLRGGMAALYDALSKPMPYKDWCVAANMEENHGFLYVKKLEDLGIVTHIEEMTPGRNQKRHVYRRMLEMKTRDEIDEKATPKKAVENLFSAVEPPKPVLTPAIPGDPVVDLIVQQNVPKISNFSKPAIQLDDAIDELQERYSPFDIVIAALARLEPEYKELAKFKKTMSLQFGDLLK